MTEEVVTSIHPFFLWLLGVAAVVYFLAKYYNNSAAEFTKASSERRRAKRFKRLGRISALEEDNEWAIARIQELMVDSRERDRLAEDHSRWDHDVIMRLIRLDPDIELPDPPPLVPPKTMVKFIEPPERTE